MRHLNLHFFRKSCEIKLILEFKETHKIFLLPLDEHAATAEEKWSGKCDTNVSNGESNQR